MNKEYDDLIENHYRKVAEKHGLSSASTMEDNIMRSRETDAIVRFVEALLQKRFPEKTATIMDVGCGNGYTLDVLLKRFPSHHFVGIEFTKELHALAESRFAGHNKVQIHTGDIRKPGFHQNNIADILICQRVLINLMDIKDQQAALTNIIAAVRAPGKETPAGVLLFIEGFTSPFERLNNARDELNLSPIAPAYHNKYLPDDFFDIPQLKPISGDPFSPPNFLSTHYYVTRVLFPYHTQGKPFKRNSEFVNFFSQALPDDIGDYSPVKIHTFERS